jgi:hypothetical protein
MKSPAVTTAPPETSASLAANRAEHFGQTSDSYIGGLTLELSRAEGVGLNDELGRTREHDGKCHQERRYAHQ